MSGGEEWTTSPNCPHVGAQWLNRSRSLLRVAVGWHSSVLLKSRSVRREADGATRHDAQSQNSKPDHHKLRATPLQNSQQVNVQRVAVRSHPEARLKGAENTDMLEHQPSRPKACTTVCQLQKAAGNHSVSLHKVGPFCVTCMNCLNDLLQYVALLCTCPKHQSLKRQMARYRNAQRPQCWRQINSQKT